jgi:hypothetical protein
VTSFLVLALSLAVPFVQDGARERVKSAVATYVSPRTKAEDRTRIVERLGAMGLAAVGFIQSVADTSGPGGAFPPTRFLANEVKVDLLRRLGDERGAQAILKLHGMSGTIQAADVSLESILDELRRQGLGVMLVNPAEQDELAGLRFSAKASAEPLDQLLDRLLQKHRLDYYARGSVVVIASRSWLWGPPAAAAPDAALQARMAEALGQLDSEFVDRRTGAERTIIEGGPAVIPILEKEQARSSGVRKDRLEMLADRILARHVPDRLHPFDAEPGLISEDARDFLRAAKDRTISISFFRGTPLSEIVARIAEFSETPIVIDPSVPAGIAGRKLTVAADRAPVVEVLEALVVPLGAVVRPEAGRLLIVPHR